MKRLLSLFLCLLMIIGCFAGCKKKAVPTVASGEQITRGAWVKLLADSFYLNSTTEKPYFSDVAKDNEIFNAIQACVDLGIIEKEDKFNKDNAVTYKEIALNTINAIGISTVQDYLKTDKKLSEKQLIDFATDKDIVKSVSENFATTTDAQNAVKTAVDLYINKPFVEKEKTELSANVIDLKDQKISVANDSFTYDKADKLKAGDIVILPPTEDYVGGLARKVESISGNTVNTVTPKLEEVYETIQLSSVTVPKISDIKAANDGVTFENYSEIELTSAKSKPQVTTLALNSNNNGDVFLLGNKGASFNVNINITKGKLSIDEGWNSLSVGISDELDEEELKKIEKNPKFKYDKNGKMYTSKYKGGYEIKGKISISDLSLTNDIDFGLIKGLKKAEAKVNFKASVNLSVKGKIDETIDVFTTSIPIGTTGLWVDAVFSLVFDSNGDVSVKCTLENTTNYTYEKGFKSANNTNLNNKAAIAGNFSSKIGPRAILVALGIDLFDIQAMIGLASKAEVSAEQGTSEIPCVDVKVYAPTLSIAFAGDKNTLLNQLGFNATWKVYDIDGGWQKPLTTLTYHYEAKNGWVDKCTNPKKNADESITSSSQQQSSSPQQNNPTPNKLINSNETNSTNSNTANDFKVIKTYSKVLGWPTTTTNSITLYDLKSLNKCIDIEIVPHKSIPNLLILSKGTIKQKKFSGTYSETEFYKISYKNKEYYAYTYDLIPEGELIKAEDGKSFKVGQTVYKGKYHDIIVLGNGNYCCSDGCDGRLSTGYLFGGGPLLDTYNEYCSYADSHYIDSSTGVSYPLCATLPVYTGKYGTVYVLSNQTIYEKENRDDCIEGFYVIRNKPYRSITMQDVDENTRKELQERFGTNASFEWSYNSHIYTFSDAKLQADSFENVRGSVLYTDWSSWGEQG